ncbi:ComF family protein [Streptodolium elevatio]|uniref:Phosphoribosyltransferase family protein n=1 Tax=Streptodolium elevatio TaxID=3157996 RepID=A0ABV3DUQ8_9ACTN
MLRRTPQDGLGSPERLFPSGPALRVSPGLYGPPVSLVPPPVRVGGAGVEQGVASIPDRLVSEWRIVEKPEDRRDVPHRGAMRHEISPGDRSGIHSERRPRPRPLRRLATTWLDLVLPARCAGCGGPGTTVCPACRAHLRRPPREVRPDPAPAGLPAVFAAAPYEDPVRAILIAHKEYGAHAASRPLGAALAAAVLAATRENPGCPPVLVPVPSARRAVRARGRDTTRNLALRAAADLRKQGVGVRVLPVLRQIRTVRDQSELSASERVANVTGALGVSRRLAPLFGGISVVIVDDLVTTGASLAEAARAVAAADGRVCGAAVVAATPRRSGRGTDDRTPSPSAVAYEVDDQLGRTGGQPHRHGAMDGVLRGHCRQGPQDRGARTVPQAQRREAGQDPQTRRPGDQRRP